MLRYRVSGHHAGIRLSAGHSVSRPFDSHARDGSFPCRHRHRSGSRRDPDIRSGAKSPRGSGRHSSPGSCRSPGAVMNKLPIPASVLMPAKMSELPRIASARLGLRRSRRTGYCGSWLFPTNSLALCSRPLFFANFGNEGRKNFQPRSSAISTDSNLPQSPWRPGAISNHAIRRWPSPASGVKARLVENPKSSHNGGGRCRYRTDRCDPEKPWRRREAW